MRIKLFVDSADLGVILRHYRDPDIAGFTTNPTLMRRAGISDYAGFARAVLDAIPDRPVSFEVFADDLDGMEREARIIRSWADNTVVKIPATNTHGVSSAPVIERLSAEGHHLNVTAILSARRAETVIRALDPAAPAIVSVFAGRIADTGRDPEPVVRDCVAMVADRPHTEVLWASPREVLNIHHAERSGCHIITASEDLLAKRRLLGRDLDDYALETVRMFHDDASAAGYCLTGNRPLQTGTYGGDTHPSVRS